MRNQLSHHEHAYERKQQLNLLSYDISVLIRSAMEDQQVKNKHILEAVFPKFGMKPSSAAVYLSQMVSGNLHLPYRNMNGQLDVGMSRIQAVFDYLNIPFDDQLTKRIQQYVARFKPTIKDKRLEQILASSLPIKLTHLQEKDRESIESLVDSYLRKNPPARLKKVQPKSSPQDELPRRSAAR